MVDIIAELREDVKQSRRARRHLRNLEQTISQMNDMMKKIGTRKGLFR